MDRRTEQEYKQALDSLRYSSEGKERIMKNLMEQQEQRLEKRKSIRPLRTVLIAAAVCAALVMTAGAATVLARQTSIQFIGREQFEREYDAYLDEHDQSPDNYSNGTYTGMDFKGSDAVVRENWWNYVGKPVEETAGTAQDGWTAKRVFKSDAAAIAYGLRQGQVYDETRYLADRASDYGSLWDWWDLSWLESHYTANPYGTCARTVSYRDDLRFAAMNGEYKGEDGAMFYVSWSWDASFLHPDEYKVANNKEFAEVYTTKDGVEAAIEMDTSKTGKSVFWVTVWSGYNSFDMFGTQVELEEIHNILDSLNLSALLEYAPE